MLKIIMINGYPRCGKDTFVENIIIHAKNINPKHIYIYNLSCIDLVKKAAKILGWNKTKTSKDRQFLADLKILTDNYNDFIFKSLCESIKAIKFYYDKEKNIVFIHCRSKNDIDRYKNKFDNCYSLLINRDNFKPTEACDVDLNIDTYDYDFIINIKDLNDSKMKAEKFLFNLLKEEKCNVSSKLDN